MFCSTDDQAFGVMRAARELGMDVPGDLAVAGFDDVKEAGLTDPPLTTVGSDREGMAKAAVDLVLDDSLRPAGSRGQRVRQFPARLVDPALVRLRFRLRRADADVTAAHRAFLRSSGFSAGISARSHEAGSP